MQHDRVWSLHTFHRRLGNVTKKYLTSMSEVSGDLQEGKKLLVENQEYRATVPHMKSNHWTKTNHRHENESFKTWGRNLPDLRGRQHRQPEPGSAASPDTRSRRCEAEQALPGSRERIHLLTQHVMKHQLLLEGVTTELMGSRKELGAWEIKHMRCYSWQRHILDQKGCQDTLLEDERVS